MSLSFMVVVGSGRGGESGSGGGESGDGSWHHHLEFKSLVVSSFLTCFGSNWIMTSLSNITLCVD